MSSALLLTRRYRIIAQLCLNGNVRGGLGNLLQGRAERFVQYLMDKVTRIHSQLDPMPGERPCPVIWEQFQPFGSDEVDRILDVVSATTYHLCHCPSWMVKASRMVPSW